MGSLEEVECVAPGPMGVLDDPEVAAIPGQRGEPVEPGAEPGLAVDRAWPVDRGRPGEGTECLGDDRRSPGGQPARDQPRQEGRRGRARRRARRSLRTVADRLVDSAPDERRSMLAASPRELLEEPRLAGPGRRNDEPSFRRPGRSRPVEGSQQRRQLGVTAEGRRTEIAHGRLARADRQRTDRDLGADRIRLCPELQVTTGPSSIAPATASAVASDRSTARGRRGLQARGGVDRVAGQSADIRAGVSVDDFAGRDAHPDGDHAGLEAELGVEPLDGRRDREPTAGGPLSVVVKRRRDAEGCHGRVADELLEHAAVALHGLADRREVAVLDCRHVLGVETLGERGEPDQIGEQDADDPPLVRCGRDGRRHPLTLDGHLCSVLGRLAGLSIQG